MWNCAVVVDVALPSKSVMRVAVGGDHDDLVLAELDGVAGVLDERGDVGAEEHLAVADADHQRRGAAGGDDRARVVGVGEHQGEVALEPRQHGAAPSRRNRLRCRRGGTARTTRCTTTSVSVSLANSTPVGLELGAQRGEVLDDAVVDDGDLARGVAVRVGVAVGRPAVGGPAGVADARCCPSSAAGVGLGQRLLEVGEPARAPADRQPAVAVEQRDARRSRSRGTPSGAARRRRRRGQAAARRSRRFRT